LTHVEPERRFLININVSGSPFKTARSGSIITVAGCTADELSANVTSLSMHANVTHVDADV
jgi:hypothetical protein